MSGPRLEFRGTWQGKAAKDVERPRLESGSWQAFGCTANERGWQCRGSDFVFVNDEQCTALDALGEPNR